MNKYVAFLDILGFKNKLGNITQNEAKQYIMQFSSVIYSAFQVTNSMQPCRWASRKFRMVILLMPQAHLHSSGNNTDEALIVYNNLGVEGYDLP